MQYNELKGLMLPRLTLGTAQLGMSYGIANTMGKPNYEHSIEILNAAMAGGITSFDTSNDYGESEVVLGRYFANLPPKSSRPIISTKISVETDCPLSRGQLYSNIRNSVERSLERLRLDSVEILMLHNIRDLIRHSDSLIRTLVDIRNEGLVRSIGVSVYSSQDVSEVTKYQEFNSIQAPINIFDTHLIRSGMLERLKESGVIVFARSVFLQGLFFRNPETLPSYLALAEPYLQKLRNVARDEGTTVAQLAFAFVRDQTGVASLVVGAETVQQIKDNLVLLNTPTISSWTLNRLHQLFQNVPEQVIRPYMWK